MSLFKNMYRLAQVLIPRERFEYRIPTENIITGAGRIVPSFGEWKSARAFIQPGIVSSFGGKNIEEKDYKDMGLDFSHRYITLWVDSADIGTVANGVSAVQVKVRDRIWNVIHTADWIVFNGWKRIYAEEVMP